MVIGYVLVNTAPGKEQAVFNALQNIDHITELHPVFGEYDILVKVEVKDFDELGRMVVDKIRAVQGVVDTRTLPAIKF